MLVEHELLLFAGFFFLIGALDEFAVDLVWLWLRVTGRARTVRLPPAAGSPAPLSGSAAVFIAAWREAGVIGATVRHTLSVWPQDDLRLYIGTYRNDPLTAEAVIAAADNDPRLRLVIHDRDGPSTKADCLNRIFRALEDDEVRGGVPTRMVVIHDAEDMVDPAALGVLDTALEDVDLAQLPVLPEPLAQSRWIASHYCEEFAEAHGKAMVVRDALGTGIPTAGVGCAIRRGILTELADRRGQDGPFAAECLTEDYELGLGVTAMGGRSRFLRCRSADGRLVATRACFPATIGSAVRQKTRWVHGIALQSWDRLGWSARPADIWMRLRDRRGPLTALVLASAYLLLIVAAAGWLGHRFGLAPAVQVTTAVTVLVGVNLLSFAWRAVWRFAFTMREYGWVEGVRAVLRIPVANVIAILAGRRALFDYLAVLRGSAVRWEKTCHIVHPALRREARVGA
ncbi:bacteriophage N4 adsorption protein B [Tsuneonella dongtanensis]|uniref:Bacteriophage N4 adsorption protein B n=1 Tax=Tsuneonella dongtanensis TaxID=692370 RepID=A0A1B2ACU3_9SPHN|nr:bacteriophage N4 adsorption protein B [Tsuneonella dongtanensis]